MTILTVTFIRHGQSEDNPKGIWAGWKDAPLTTLGQKQAQALGRDLSATHIDVVYASPLLRAYQTAEAVRAGQPEGSRPPLHVNPKLRERHFGIAEGHPVTFDRAGKSYDQCIQEGIYPVSITAQEKFPGGESEEDLDARADKAVVECILPHLNNTTKKKEHIAIASHGLAISALVAALLRLDPEADRSISYAGLLNTAWTRVIISTRPEQTGEVTPKNASLKINITDVNHADHLRTIPKEELYAGLSAADQRTLALLGGAKEISVSASS